MKPPTHVVTNQPPPLVGYDVAAADAALTEGVARHGATGALDWLGELGRRAGSEQAQEWSRLANTHTPTLRTHDRYGHRIDEVEFDASWHALMTVAVTNGLHAAPWVSSRPSPHLTRAAGFYVWSQARAGTDVPSR